MNYTVNKCKEILKYKYNITKNISKYNKKQLNELVLLYSSYNYEQRKKENKKNRLITLKTTPDILLRLFRNEHICTYIMSFIIDVPFIEYFNKQMAYILTTNIQLSQLYRYCIKKPNRHCFINNETTIQYKDTLESIHLQLSNRDQYYDENICNNDVYNKIRYTKHFCECHINEPCIITKMPLKLGILYYNK